MVKLFGLVLAGGKSERMGTDKGKICWHGKEQRYWMADVLKKFCSDVYISCRADQIREINRRNYKTIEDEFSGTGPLGAILSAYNVIGDVAWLVVACDMPFLDVHAIRYLIDHRDINSIATAYESPADHLPEPLAAIWEPQAEPLLREALKQNKLSPREILMQRNIACISPVNPVALMNANYPGDCEMRIMK
jgi:molybdopterin-guanine dinucleotide biosynthesis protein A